MGDGIGTRARWTAVAGLGVGAVGLVVLKLAGQAMPAVPPGLVLLVGAAVLLAVVDRWWAAAVGALVAAAEVAGFVLTGAVAGLVAADSPGVLVGSWLRGVGTAVALVAGVVAALRRRAPTRGAHS